ncbi:MAG: MaoC family dehydratase [SAR202 cluster bacterium]|nr:MaoC family dehydratase [SAR202 cluster bacterium]
MAQQTSASTLTDEQKQSILQLKGEAIVLEVEKGHIKRFAEAIGDANPLFIDEAAARNTRYGGIIAPPTFLRAAGSSIPVVPALEGFDGILDAGSEWEYGEPIKAGDVITSQLGVRNVSARNLSVGPSVFVVFEATYMNQFSTVVARQRMTLIRYKGAR